MLNEMMFLQFSGFYGGGFGELLNYWEQAGFFSYVIPFLLIFAIVFGILTQMNMFGRKKETGGRTVNAIIALSVSLLSLQFDLVPRFFSEIFPRVGIGLAIILVIIIITSLFTDPEQKWQMYIMWGLSVLVVIIIMIQTAGAVGWASFLPFLGYNWPYTLSIIIFIVVIAVVIGSARDKSTTEAKSPFAKMLGEMYNK